ncbi:Subunit of heteropentameric Replication factor C (RF-C) [Yamadazyma tenuis]|uniref:Replication factor C subunit 2 n=1 Tax=Candida tenuis (strain ATCC 10573 / BCRC 21748 / CBS 615 / JCM 9827 / NBRC 10315 / NRRL Y-1498 / VKM Y-70) TaxID=590646 RepID=G3BBI2_CANTC|nr:P-loop containing nucleoside triphosphate hydrolase protein [Yamadazyma tenuis ATCC 10573]EGV61545.1 P-loop containing nucleoside triphosphate hydrolase protein [Yamadazyma tenuis ATCC 10573]WEJ92767.1 Subunit of heteropentameric Replication factor C (RF-C) [Yamadazyma tenuis]
MVSEAERSTRNKAYEQEKIEHTPWVEKYRPKSLDDVASQDHTVKVLKRTLVSANLPHMLFYGPPGTGKTSTILALAKSLYGPILFKSRVLELNASDERGISIVRQKIKNFARLTISNPSPEDLEKYPCPPYKIIILDEADSMTNDAQSALRRTMETYSGVTRFCLVCNYITRIIDPLASRCSKFRFKPLNNSDALGRLQYIAGHEGIEAEEGTLEEVLKISNGDLRRAITYLQSATRLHSSLKLLEEDISIGTNKITVDSILEVGGVVSDEIIDKILSTIESKDSKEIIEETRNVVLQGYSAQQVIDQLHDKLIMDDSRSSIVKNHVSQLLFTTDKRLNSGTDEHIQLLNLFLKVSQII